MKNKICRMLVAGLIVMLIWPFATVDAAIDLSSIGQKMMQAFDQADRFSAINEDQAPDQAYQAWDFEEKLDQLTKGLGLEVDRLDLPLTTDDLRAESIFIKEADQAESALEFVTVYSQDSLLYLSQIYYGLADPVLEVRAVDFEGEGRLKDGHRLELKLSNRQPETVDLSYGTTIPVIADIILNEFLVQHDFAMKDSTLTLDQMVKDQEDSKLQKAINSQLDKNEPSSQMDLSKEDDSRTLEEQLRSILPADWADIPLSKDKDLLDGLAQLKENLIQHQASQELTFNLDKASLQDLLGPASNSRSLAQGLTEDSYVYLGKDQSLYLTLAYQEDQVLMVNILTFSEKDFAKNNKPNKKILALKDQLPVDLSQIESDFGPANQEAYYLVSKQTYLQWLDLEEADQSVIAMLQGEQVVDLIQAEQIKGEGGELDGQETN